MRCVDLFAGCGGLSLGLMNAGIDVVAALDNWKNSIEVYSDNFAHECYLQDLTNEAATLSIIDRYKPDMIAGGPPCQDFSSAGKRDETLGRADLTHHFANIVCAIKPTWFLMENVERIKKSKILDDVISQYKNSGYGLSSAILSAEYCGVPQTRKRFFLIGEHNGPHNSIIPHLGKRLSSKPMSLRDYFGDTLGVKYYYRHPRSYRRRGVFSIDEPSPTIRGVNRPVPPGYPKHPGDPQEVNLKEIRPLTTIERSQIQTFPKSFKFTGAKTSMEQMIGNAVPVKLAEFVGNSIMGYINQERITTENQMNLWSEPNEFVLAQTSLHRYPF